jgi:hypothetical protein
MKTNLTHYIAVALSMAVSPAVQAGQSHLRYEWSATPAGPFMPVPPDMIKVHADGSATVATSSSRGFFRLNFADGGADGGGGSVPVRTLDSVPATTLEMIRQFIAAVAEDRSEEGIDWTGVTIAPFVTPVTSAWNITGEPDLVELKLVGPCETPAATSLFANEEGPRRSTDRGFILASLSRKSPLIVSYDTDGPTQCESLLANCRSAPVHTIRRFGPMFLAAEDEEGNLVGNEGLYPVIYPDEAYEEYSRPLSYSWDSENPDNPALPEAPRPVEPLEFSNYRQLLAAYHGSSWLTKRRQQREAFIEFDWLAMEGRAPKLEVEAGKQEAFLDSETFTRFALDDEDETGGTIVSLGAAGGVSVRGVAPGAWKLTLFPATGLPQRYLIVVSPAGRQPRGGPVIVTTTRMWECANGEAGQPRYDQRWEYNRWCPAVGCGPVMLALQIAWAEHNQNVPSAYWNRDLNAPLSNRRASLREIDSPMNYFKGIPADLRMRRWYDFLHEQCNVWCKLSGAGSSNALDVGIALGIYFNYTTGQDLPVKVAQDNGGPLVGGSFGWEADIISDDWDESGVRAANAIKAGRTSGVLFIEHGHFCMAWRYRRTIAQLIINGEVSSTTIKRFFKANSGWGDHDVYWNAYDIDGCYLLNLFQKRQAP